MNKYMYSEGTVKVEDVVKKVSGSYMGKAIGDSEFIDDYISYLLDGEEVFVDYFKPENLYKFYTASMEAENESIIVEVENDVITDIYNASWNAYR